MRELPWIEIGRDEYVAEMQCGRAVIRPHKSKSNDELYTVQLEFPSGEVVWEDVFDFETAKMLAQIRLPLLDQVEGRLSECGLIEETLDLCQSLISRETDALHWLRIEHLKKWIAPYMGQTYEMMDIPIPPYPPIEFNWIEDGNQFYIDTPYGRAIITETRNKNIIGGGIRHLTKIVHHSGAMLDCYSWIDFMEAEYAIK